MSVAAPSLLLSVTVTALLFSTTHTRVILCAELKVERACCRASLTCLQRVSFVAVPTTAGSAAAVCAMINKNPVCACRILSGFCVRCFAFVRVAVFREMELYGDRCIRLHSCFVGIANRWRIEG